MMKEALKVGAFALITALAVPALGACSSSVPTCAEFAAMGDDTGLLTALTDEQTSALKAALDKEGFDDGSYNQTLGKTEVIAYCDIYGGVASANKDQPITEAL